MSKIETKVQPYLFPEWKDVEKPSKSALYTCKSAVQKAIRRGNVEDAVRYGRMVWLYDPFTLWRRLLTIMFEECAGVCSTFAPIWEKNPNSENWSELEQWIVSLCGAPKSRELSSLAYNANNETALSKKFPEELQYLMKRGLLEGSFSIYRELGYDADLVDFCERCFNKWDYEKQSLFLPYILECSERQGCLAPVDAIQFEVCDKKKDGMMITALDQHTFAGKEILKIFWRNRADKLMSAGFKSAEEFGHSWWMVICSHLTNVYPMILSDICNPEVVEKCGPLLYDEKKAETLSFADDFCSLVEWFIDKRLGKVIKEIQSI